MTARRQALQTLIEEIRRAGGAVSLHDGRAVVSGAVDGRLLLRVHRHRRDLARLLG